MKEFQSFNVRYRPDILQGRKYPVFGFQFHYGTTGFADGQIDFNNCTFNCVGGLNSSHGWHTDYALFDAEKGGMDNWNTYMSIAIRRWLYENKQERNRVNFGFEGVKRYYDRFSTFEHITPWWWSSIGESEILHGEFEDSVDYYGEYVDGHLHMEDMTGKNVRVIEDWFIPKEEKHSYGISI